MRFYDFCALVTEGLKWLTVSTTSVGRKNLLWKQIDAPVGFGCKLYIRKHSEKDFKVSIVFEMIDFQWGFNAIFMVPLSYYFNPWKCRRTRHKIHFMGHKNAVKRSQKYSENIHGSLKIPRQGDNHDPWIFHPIKWPWICTPWKIWIYFIAFSWTPWKSHNKSNSRVIKKSHGFFMCFSLHFL